MPELPEVETLRGDAQRHLLARRVADVRVLVPEVIRQPAPEDFCRQLVGSAFVGARRRAKYLLLDLDSGRVLAMQLALFGQLLLFEKSQAVSLAARPLGTDAAPPSATSVPDTLLTMTLADGATLVAADRSRYSRVYLVPSDELANALRFDALGPEPLDPAFTAETLGALLAGRRAKLKSLLLDQHEIAGLGNIYVDEALWRAQIHPGRAANSLSAIEIAAVHGAIQAVLAEGIQNRGTTFHTYRDLLGAKGRHQDHLAVFHRQGRPCPRCGTGVERVNLASRDTHLCPTCQVIGSARTEPAPTKRERTEQGTSRRPAGKTGERVG